MNQKGIERWVMTCDEIIAELKTLASDKYKFNVVRKGVPEIYCIGVSTTIIRKIAKGLKKSNKLAYELWETRYNEARLLAVLLFEKDCLSIENIECLMDDVISWDLCDHLCKNLIIKMNDYEFFIKKWMTSSHIYKKRASFVLIASSIRYNKDISDTILDNYLLLIYKNSHDKHDHIKKAVSWALREIGKRNRVYNKKVILLANNLKNNGDKIQVWVANSVIKELENIVKIDN